jgi:hypothetical protein
LESGENSVDPVLMQFGNWQYDLGNSAKNVVRLCGRSGFPLGENLS